VRLQALVSSSIKSRQPYLLFPGFAHDCLHRALHQHTQHRARVHADVPVMLMVWARIQWVRPAGSDALNSTDKSLTAGNMIWHVVRMATGGGDARRPG
jgi:hypothetical protein